MIVRPMRHLDLHAVLGIEADSFEFPWSRSDFVNLLRDGDCRCYVATDDDRKRILGYVTFEKRPQGGSQILGIAVHERFRRQGIGRQLIDMAPSTPLETQVRETNAVAQRFFSAVGFRATHIDWQPFKENDEDAYVMRLDAVQELA